MPADTPSTLFQAAFLAALALTTAVKLLLARRHTGFVRAHRDRVPAAFMSRVDAEAHAKAADYSIAKTRLGIWSTLLECAVALALTLGGGIEYLNGVASSWFAPGVAQGLALIALVTGATLLVDMPLGYYRAFGIEQRFGFNKMTRGMYFADAAKHLLLAAALGLPLAAAVLALMAGAGEHWWLYAWALWAGFNLLVLAVYPTWIAPLFNTFTPLDDGALRERIERLLAKCGFHARALMVMDGSKRSAHGNAYFTGFGRSKRIVFFDTLLSRLEPPEIEAVLAHELGHFKLRHVVKRLAWSFFASFAFLWLLSQLMQAPWFFNGLGVRTPSTAAALILFFTVMPVFLFPLRPALSAYSRRHEFEADRYAALHASSAALVSALIKLYTDNASTLTPDPLHSAFYDSHPPALLRIARLQTAAA